MKELIKQAFKFFGISGIGWIIDFTIYTILTSIFKLNVDISNIISSLSGCSFVFMISTRKLFENNSKINIKIKYAIYIIFELLLIFTSSKIMFLLKNNLINIKLIAKYINILVKILITPFTMIINFIFMKNLIEKI